MKLFSCQNCGNLLYFENSCCEKCGLNVGYIPEIETLSAVTSEGSFWRALADKGSDYRFCANWELKACNWLVAGNSSDTYCRACRHNRTIPDLADLTRLELWKRVETAKRRLVYSLLKFRLPLPLVDDGDTEPLVFDFLDELSGRKIMTGHDNGLITIVLKEADDAEREKLRASMNEPYRTLLGHFRHEIGHFYWDRLVRDGSLLQSFRDLFGDERASYQEALDTYYATPLPANWQERYVSAYATMHPWEDFAESWAHYLHIVDTLEMAYAFGLSVAPRVAPAQGLTASIDDNPYKVVSTERLLSDWLPITFAVNSLNRAMGQPDLYPFIITPLVAEKLDFIGKVIKQA